MESHTPIAALCWKDEIETYKGHCCTLWEAAFSNVSPPDKDVEIDDFVIPSKSPFIGKSIADFLWLYRDYVTLPTYKVFVETHKIFRTGKQLAPLLPKWKSTRNCPLCSSALLVRINTRSDIYFRSYSWNFQCPECEFVETTDGEHSFDCRCMPCNTPGHDCNRQRWLGESMVRQKNTTAEDHEKLAEVESSVSARETLGNLKRENLALKTALALVVPENGQAVSDLLQGYVFDKMSGEDVAVLLALLERRITIDEAEQRLGVKRF